MTSHGSSLNKVVSLALFSALMTTASPVFASDDLAALTKKMEAMMNRIEKLEQDQASLVSANQSLATENQGLKQALENIQTAAGDAPMKKASSSPSSGATTVPGTETTIKLGGYIKADAIGDIGSGHGSDFAGFASIPLDGSAAADKSGDFHMHARQTRLNLTTMTPTDKGDLKTFVEVDFYGTRGTDLATNGHNPQLRHAYGEYRGILAGQTWTNFADMSAYPESLDYVGVVGVPLVRQVQLRYSDDLTKSLSYSLSMENPNADFINAGGDTVVDGSKFPDVVGSLVQKTDWGHVALKGIVRDITVENETDRRSESAVGYGAALSAKVNIGAKDNIMGRITYGDGIGRYIYDVATSAQSAGYNSDRLEKQSAFASYASYQHHWTDNLRSNFMAGYTSIDNATDLIGTARNEDIWSAHANLLWQPYKKVRVGVEYMHGERSLENGTDGSLDRVMGSVIYSLD